MLANPDKHIPSRRGEEGKRPAQSPLFPQAEQSHQLPFLSSRINFLAPFPTFAGPSRDTSNPLPEQQRLVVLLLLPFELLFTISLLLFTSCRYIDNYYICKMTITSRSDTKTMHYSCFPIPPVQWTTIEPSVRIQVKLDSIWTSTRPFKLY